MSKEFCELIKNVPYKCFGSVCKFPFGDATVYLDKSSDDEWIEVTLNNMNITLKRGLFKRIFSKVRLDSSETRYVKDLPFRMEFDSVLNFERGIEEGDILPLMLFAFECGTKALLDTAVNHLKQYLRSEMFKTSRPSLCQNLTEPLKISAMCKVLDMLETTALQILWLEAIVFDRTYSWSLIEGNTRVCLDLITDTLVLKGKDPVDNQFLRKLSIARYLPASLIVSEKESTLDGFDGDSDMCWSKGDMCFFKGENTWKDLKRRGDVNFDKITYEQVGVQC